MEIGMPNHTLPISFCVSFNLYKLSRICYFPCAFGISTNLVIAFILALISSLNSRSSRAPCLTNFKKLHLQDNNNRVMWQSFVSFHPTHCWDNISGSRISNTCILFGLNQQQNLHIHCYLMRKYGFHDYKKTATSWRMYFEGLVSDSSLDILTMNP